MRQRLVSVGEGVKISEPVKVERGLVTGSYIYASLSHQGVLAIYAYKSVQLTNLNTNRQVKMRVWNESITGFYNDKALMLTYETHLREAVVEEVFSNPNIKTFKRIKGTGKAFPWTDVSLLQERRVLYYPTIDDELFAFNVDTRTNTEIDVGRRVWYVASLTGIDCGVKAVFQSNDDDCTYTLNTDDTVTKVGGEQNNWLTALLPSTSSPKSVKDGVFMYENRLVKDGKEIDTSHLIRFNGYSTIRVYKDIFLVYDKSTKSWVLVRITVP